MKQEKNNQTPTVIHFNYEGNPVSFSTDNGIMVNATEMAKPFGNEKRPQFWLKNESSKEFLETLSVARNLATEQLVYIRQGGAIQGTWMHEDAALEFARWLSPKFAIWCNDRIKELLTKGQMSLQSEDHPVMKNFMKHHRRKAYEYNYIKKVEPTPETCCKNFSQSSPELYDEMRAYCMQWHFPIRNFMTIAIYEKLQRVKEPEKYSQAVIAKEVEISLQRIDFLEQLLEAKDETISVLKAQKGGSV